MKIVLSSLLASVLILSCGCVGNAPSVKDIPDGAIVAARVSEPDVRAYEIPDLFASGRIEYHAVTELNWPEQYPYLPKVDFAIAHNGTDILVHYRVTERRTVGTMERDLQGVYQESCCELFIMEEGDSLYYNIESNCLGSILMQCGTGRSDRITSTPDNLKEIDRWASLGRTSVGVVEEQTHWELSLVIPIETFWNHSFGSLDGKSFLGNVYNCIGAGDDRQYVTWCPIVSEAPDFHRPESFRRIFFAEGRQ